MKARILVFGLMAIGLGFSQQLVARIQLPGPNWGRGPEKFFHCRIDSTLWVGTDSQAIVLNAVTGEILDGVAAYSQVTDIVWNSVGDKVYVADYTAHITVVERSTRHVLSRIYVGTTGSNGTRLAWCRNLNRLYAAREYDTLLTVINCASDSIIGHIPGIRHITAMCPNPSGTKLYCTDADLGAVRVVDCATGAIVSTVFTGGEPNSLVYDSLLNKVYCADGSDQDVAAIDAVRDSIIRFISIDANADCLCLDPVEQKLYCGTGDNCVAVISALGDSLLATAYADGAVRAVAFDSADRVVYAAVPGRDCVAMIDAVNNGYLGSLAVGDYPVSVASLPEAGRVYVALGYDATLAIITSGLRRVTGAIALGMWPGLLAWSAGANRAYCAGDNNGVLAIIDGATDSVRKALVFEHTVTGMLPVPAEDKLYCGTEWSPDSAALYAVSLSGDSVISVSRFRGVTGIMCYSPTSRRLFCSGGALSSPYGLRAYDCRADTLVWESALGMQARALAWSPQDDRVYATSSDFVSVYDAGSGTRLRDFYVPHGPAVLCYVPGHNYVVAAIHDSTYITFFDAATCSLLARVEVGHSPTTMVYNARHDRLYCSVAGALVVGVDCATLLPSVVVPVSDDYPVMALDTVADRLYARSRYSLDVIDCARNRRRVLTAPECWKVGIAWNPVNRRVYVGDNDNSQVWVYQDTTVSGIEDSRFESSEEITLPGIVRGEFFLWPPAAGRQRSAVLLDISGHKVADLHPGANDLRGIAAGVYFVRTGDGRGDARRSLTRKLMIAK